MTHSAENGLGAGSAEVLHRAAAEIRKEQRHAFYLAVAEWLDHEADRIALGGPAGVVITPGEVRRSLGVARAYLSGGDA